MGVPAGSSELGQPKAAIKRELSSDRPPAPPAKRLLSMAELEKHLLKGYSNRPFTSDLSDVGQVLHGLVAACLAGGSSETGVSTWASCRLDRNSTMGH